MTPRKLLLLLGFGQDETKMASVRWKRFGRHLTGGPFAFEWAPIKLPYCRDSASTPAKAIREFSVLRHAIGHARRLAAGRNSQVRTTVLASIPTLDPLYVGAILKQVCRRKVELVLEIRDIYARPELFEYKSARRRLEVFKESLLIRRVDRFIFLTDEIKRRYGDYYPGLSNLREGAVITNGYDLGEYGSPTTAAVRSDCLDIGYFGSFYGSRNPELLFEGLALLRRKGWQGPQMRVHIWGEPGNYPLQARILEHGLGEVVVYHGIAPHERIIREYAGSGVNLIITHTAGSSYALPGKLFEYIGAARPVWAITDDEILRTFVARHKLGYLSPHRAESIAETLRAIARDHTLAGGLPAIGRVADFEIGSLTRQLETFLMDGEHVQS